MLILSSASPRISKAVTILLKIIILILASAATTPAQTFQNLIMFNGRKNGQNPNGPLVQGLDGDYYGTTAAGGASNQGTVFKITPHGTRYLLYDFCHGTGCPDGATPQSGLILGTDGNFYGTTLLGGSTAIRKGYGTIFRITPAGILTTLYTFNFTDGAYPEAPLIQATDGNFYGVASGGGANVGTIFEITPAGVLTTLHTFIGTEGWNPNGIIQALDGNFYGTTNGGGAAFGTIFSFSQAGIFTTLHGFHGAGGILPRGLMQASDGNLYGVTGSDGTYGGGTLFRLTTNGQFTTLYNFDTADEKYPSGVLIEGTDGSLYGTTEGVYYAGTYGTMFKTTPGGNLTVLHTFDALDGQWPGSLVQGTDGSFYGPTYWGGTQSDGTLYSLSTGLSSFARTVPASGAVGSAVTVLGGNLTGVTSVTFNGTEAAYTIVSDTEITATVPSGATTGKVTVSKPGSSLISNVVFTILP
jgi:uncharacterized repeat protein (TIGR03803 family)